MIEPYDQVWISRMDTPGRRLAYHRPDRDHAVLQVTTRCEKLALLDCEPVSEIEAALEHEPCKRCFPARGRRQRILDLIVVAGVEDA